MLIELDTAIG